MCAEKEREEKEDPTGSHSSSVSIICSPLLPIQSPPPLVELGWLLTQCWQILDRTESYHHCLSLEESVCVAELEAAAGLAGEAELKESGTCFLALYIIIIVAVWQYRGPTIFAMCSLLSTVISIHLGLGIQLHRYRGPTATVEYRGPTARNTQVHTRL